MKINNVKTHDSFISNLKGVTIILTQVWGSLSFCNTSREGSIIYPREKGEDNIVSSTKVLFWPLLLFNPG